MKPFFAEGSTISMREFIVGALHKEMGLGSTIPTWPKLVRVSVS